MKKLVILGTALLALNAVASEVQIKGGYDFNRNYRAGVSAGDFEVKNGATAGLEYIFDNQGEFEWGLGSEYKFSTGSGKLQTKVGDVKLGRVVPVYALGKFNLVTTKKGNDVLYVVGRAGYAFAKEYKELAGTADVSGGLYVAGGLGTEWGPVSLEAIYERANIKVNDGVAASRDKLDTFGVRLGYRFGNLVNNRQPKVVVETREVIRTVNVPAPAPVTKTVNTNTVALPFSCSVNERKCVIRGFKVDGREPNEVEARDLRTIANVINQFAEGGSIDFVGHTDSTGSAAYNQKLSVARAQNVAKLLRDYGLKNTVSYGTVTGKGLTQPADTNNTVQGRYNNRRVELFFKNVDFTNVNFIQ